MKHTYKTPFSFDGENEVELSILYTMTSGTMSDSGPTYDCAGEPFEYPEVDVLGVMVDDRAAIESLVRKGKIIIQEDGEMMVRRCQEELERGLRRIQEASERGSRGGRPRIQTEQNQSVKKPNPFSDEKLSPSPSPSPSPSLKSIIEAAVAPKAKRASRIDPNWTLSEQGRYYAKDRGLDQTTIDRVAEGFRDHWIASAGKGAVALDWDAKWRTWVNNHLRFTGSQTTAGGQKPQRNHQGAASLTAVRDKIRADLGLLQDGSFDEIRTEGDTRPNGDGTGAWSDGLVIEHDAG